MGHRKNVSTYKAEFYQGPPSPNATVNAISVDIRVFFPPNAKPLEIIDVLNKAVAEVKVGILNDND